MNLYVSLIERLFILYFFLMNSIPVNLPGIPVSGVIIEVDRRILV